MPWSQLGAGLVQAQVVERVRAPAGIEYETLQQSVVRHSGELNAGTSQYFPAELHVVTQLGGRAVGQEFSQRATRRVGQRWQVGHRGRCGQGSNAVAVTERQIPGLSTCQRQPDTGQRSAANRTGRGLDGKRHWTAGPQGIDQAGKVGGIIDHHHRRCVLHRGDSPLPDHWGRGVQIQPLRQAVELELRQQGRQGFRVRLPRHQVGELHVDGKVALEGDQVAGQARVVGVGRERFARTFLLQRRSLGDDGLEIAVLLQQRNRPLGADAFYSGYVVRAVAYQREVVDHLAGRHAQPFFGVGHVDPLLGDRGRAAPARIEQSNVVVDELIKILITRNDHRLVPGLVRPGGERSDHVVRLVAGDLDLWQVKRLQQRADVIQRLIEVRLQLVVEFFAGRLVLWIGLSAKRIARVIDPGDVVGLVLGVDPLGGSERPADHGEERAIDQGVPVHQEQLRRSMVRHSRVVLFSYPARCTRTATRE